MKNFDNDPVPLQVVRMPPDTDLIGYHAWLVCERLADESNAASALNSNRDALSNKQWLRMDGEFQFLSGRQLAERSVPTTIGLLFGSERCS